MEIYTRETGVKETEVKAKVKEREVKQDEGTILQKSDGKESIIKFVIMVKYTGKSR